MKKSENVMEKILHISESTSKGVIGGEKGKTHGKHTMFHPKIKHNMKQHLGEAPIWQSKKRKTHP